MENIPVHTNGHDQRTHLSHPGVDKTPKGKRMQRRRIVISIIAVLILAGLVIGGLSMVRQLSGVAIDSGKYQAVFLSSGQVYFGKLQNTGGDYMKLTDVFYLQTKTDTSSGNPQKTATSDTNVELIKLGSEIHGPEDAMIISRTQVLFYENLKADGKVSQSIVNYRKQ
ncbi:MAG: hypothetical protein ABIP50_01060 [Candidatus Saccharimonadales bacterium]